MVISGEILQLRLIKGLNQKGIAKKLGISQPRYCKLEQCAEINKEKTNKIITLLGYTKDEVKEN